MRLLHKQKRNLLLNNMWLLQKPNQKNLRQSQRERHQSIAQIAALFCPSPRLKRKAKGQAWVWLPEVL